jgi:hypothetical protein
MTPDLEVFCRQIRKRSNEHARAIELLSRNHLIGPMIAILRQELDSLIRCIFVLAIKDLSYRSGLVSDAVNGRKWRRVDGKGSVTDREMVELSNQLHGWTQSVYSFGCAFIHLSQFHDYEDRNPLSTLDSSELAAINHHLSYYHGVTVNKETRLHDIAHVLPAVFEKIAGNLKYYVDELESGSAKPPSDI